MDPGKIPLLIKKIIESEDSKQDQNAKKALSILLKIMKTKKHVDVAYKKLMLIVLQQKDLSDEALLKAFDLLTILLENVPGSHEILMKVLRFCDILSKRRNEDVKTKIHQIRNSITKISKNRESSEKHTNNKEKEKEKKKKKKENSNEKQKRKQQTKKQEEQLSAESTKERKIPLITNLNWKIEKPNLFEPFGFKPKVIYHPLFGGQFEVKQGTTKASSRDKRTITLGLTEPTVETLEKKLVANETKISALKTEGDNNEKKQKHKTVTIKRNMSKLFHYKHYSEQDPFTFTEKEINLISQTILSSTKDKTLARKSLSEFWIKIAIDTYLQHGEDQFREKLSGFIQMLKSNKIGPKLMVFNLMFNLLIHSNLIFASQQLNFSNSILEIPKSTRNNFARLSRIEDLLFESLQEMILYLSNSKEKSLKVWSSALNFFLIFVTNKGKLSTQRIRQLNPQIPFAFLQNSIAFSQLAVKTLIRIIVNQIYGPVASKLEYKISATNGKGQEETKKEREYKTTDMQRKFLNLSGPFPKIISNNLVTILEIYSHSKSPEVTENLFAILYDYACHRVASGNKDSQSNQKAQKKLKEEFLAIYDLFTTMGLQSHFPQLLKFHPEQVWESIQNFIYDEQIQYNKKVKRLTKKLNKDLVNKIFVEFKTLLKLHDQIAERFQSAMEKTLNLKMINSRGIKIIKNLINSKLEEYRKSGKIWLFELMRICTVKKQKFEGRDLVRNLLNSLASTKNFYTRWIYLEIIEKLTLFHKSRMITTHSKREMIKLILKFYGEKVAKLVQNNENEQIILKQVLNILIQLVGYNNNLLLTDHTGLNSDFFKMIEDGQILISSNLVVDVPIKSLVLVIKNLSTSFQNSTARLIALYLLTEKLKLATNEFNTISGEDLFAKLIDDTDPRIAFFAAVFYNQWLSQNQKDSYKKWYRRVERKSKKQNNPDLLKNPYFLVKEILSQQQRKK
ncbi:conditional loss-of-growth [Anaeramoeba flamelloides]|uniref:Conditional loss-of-growth n=1 Tax=Anaeramoeba flamelloides TaxID=1746091 RepID=A0AAV7YTV5_9EUKA|nr:conditional loss-of-growth [Anaeramoeba flamelloides]